MPLIDQVRRFIRSHALAAADTRVTAAVSGGPDSTALAYILRELHESGDLRFTAVAHFNHQLRASADRDEQFCAELAGSLGVAFIADRADVRGIASRRQRSLEDTAHRLRYDFFERARQQTKSDVVAVGHTSDDQAETFLLRLIRGAGARGLAAMHPVHGVVVRPLLASRRRDVQGYLAAHRLTFVLDETNDDVAIPRNRVRSELLPLLERRFNPAIVDVLADEAEIAREEWRWLQSEADGLRERSCRRHGNTWLIDATEIARSPVALARLVVRGALTEAAGGTSMSFDHVERVLRLCHRPGGALHAPRVIVERLGGHVVLTGRAAEAAGRPGPVPPNFFRYSLSIPGEVAIAEAGCEVSAEAVGSMAEARAALSNSPSIVGSAVVPLDKCRPSLMVRSRRPGDRFRPVGLGGAKKLQDYFVDKKVVQSERDRVPLVVDSSDRIVWVGGHVVDEAFRVTDPAQAVLVLKLKKSAGGPF